MPKRGAYGGAALAVLLLANACAAAEVRMEAPQPDEATAALCRDLVDRLPERLFGQEQVPVRPESDFMAAWGDPPAALRCGVERPLALRPDSVLEEVNGVAWLPQPEDEPVLYTAVGREAYVELTVPPAYGAPAPGLVAISDLVGETVPALPEGRL